MLLSNFLEKKKMYLWVRNITFMYYWNSAEEISQSTRLLNLRNFLNLHQKDRLFFFFLTKKISQRKKCSLFFQLNVKPMIVFNTGICTYISVLSYMFGFCLFLFSLVTKHEKSNTFLKTSHSIGFLRVNNPKDVSQLII